MYLSVILKVFSKKKTNWKSKKKNEPEDTQTDS